MISALHKGNKKLAINGLAKETIYLKTQTNSRKNSLPHSHIQSAERKSLPKQTSNSQASEILKQRNNLLQTHGNLQQSNSNNKLSLRNLKNKPYNGKDIQKLSLKESNLDNKVSNAPQFFKKSNSIQNTITNVPFSNYLKNSLDIKKSLDKEIHHTHSSKGNRQKSEPSILKSLEVKANNIHKTIKNHNKNGSAFQSLTNSIDKSLSKLLNKETLKQDNHQTYIKLVSNGKSTKLSMPIKPKTAALSSKSIITKQNFKNSNALKNNNKAEKINGSNFKKVQINTKTNQQVIRENNEEVKSENKIRISLSSKDFIYGSTPNLVNERDSIISYIKDFINTHHTIPSTTINFYRIGRVIGKGAFGKVNLGIHILSGKYVAIKCISKKSLNDTALSEKVKREVFILQQLQHNNITRLYETFDSEKYFLLIFELCVGGDLLTYVRKRRRLKEAHSKSLFVQILEGLNYCHQKSILHKDIKLDNLLLNFEGNIKICDFGVSKIVNKEIKLTEKSGTPAYIAPEILLGNGYSGFASDYWSLGVVLYSMLYGQVPFKANKIKEMHKLIIEGKYDMPDDISEEGRDLVCHLLEINPIKRFQFEQIIKHKWFLNFNYSISTFNETEKENILKEFNYQIKNEVNQEDTENTFVNQGIDKSINELVRNSSTKSVVLAPFNTTNEEVILLDESEFAKKKIIKFEANVKEIDKIYEQNNNCEVDNGVYNKKSANDEEEKNDIDPFENCIKSPKQVKSYRKKEGGMLADYPILKIQTTEQSKIDLNIIKNMEAFGFPSELVIKSLKENYLNCATATYYLLPIIKN